jgi:hypothetical protein
MMVILLFSVLIAFRRGVIMHYTPNYAMNRLALENLCKSISFYNPKEQIKNKKFLMMLRNPVSRTTSSWWFKEWSGSKPTHATKPHFGPILTDGIAKEHALKKCYKSHGFNFSEMVKTDLDIGRMQKSHVLKKCRLQMLNGERQDERGAHVGKSLYAHTLVVLLQRHCLLYCLYSSCFL